MLAGCGSTRTVTVIVQAPFRSTPEVQTFYGRIVSLSPSGDGWVMRFDPAWWLSGVTANVAASPTPCAPSACEPVPNDHYVLDEAHEAIVFKLPRSATGTVLTSGSDPLGGTRVDAARLASLVAAGKGAKLFEQLDSGMWLRVRGDTVQAFAQQYRP